MARPSTRLPARHTMVLVTQRVFWHRELPPLDGEVVDEHEVEATSDRVPASAVQHDDLWSLCRDSLMAHARTRLEQEVERLGGHYAHVLDESIDLRRDPVADTAWLHGRFTYVLLRRNRAGA